jgi:hypothetical protein
MNDLVKKGSKKAAAALAEEAAAVEVNVPLPTRVALSPEAYKKIRKRLHEQCEDFLTRSGSSGYCWGGNCDLSGDNWHQGHGACHAWIGRGFGWNSYPPNAGKKTDSFLVLTCHSNKKATCSKEACDEIIRWMASDKSPFGKYIVNGDDEGSLMQDGAMIYCGGTDGASLNECMWICKVLRYATEGSKALDTWLALYKSGVNPLLALLIATNMSSVKGATFGATAVTTHVSVFRNGYYGDPTQGPNLLKLMAGDVNKKANATCEVFGTDSSVNPPEICAKFVKPIVEDDGWGKQIKSTGAKQTELVEQVLEWQKGIGGPVAPVFPFSAEPIQVPPPPLPTKSTVFLEMDL